MLIYSRRYLVFTIILSLLLIFGVIGFTPVAVGIMLIVAVLEAS